MNASAIFHLCLPAIAILCFHVGSYAQEETSDTPPPPVKVISKEEQDRLDTKKDMKDRTKLSVEMMNARLTAAERLASAGEFDAMYGELGHFHALMDDALDYLNKRDDRKGKVLDSFKRLGIALRGMATKIEVIRRELPVKFDTYVRKLMGYLRANREKATDSLFVDSVVPNKKPNR